MFGQDILVAVARLFILMWVLLRFVEERGVRHKDSRMVVLLLVFTVFDRI